MIKSKFKLIVEIILIFTVAGFVTGGICVYSETINEPAGNKIKTEKNYAARLEEKKQEEDSPHNLYATLSKGGPLMIFLAVLGLISTTIIIERGIFFTRNKAWSRDKIENELKGISSKSKTKFLEDREDELRKAFQNFANKMERGMGLLSGVGNLSPIVGFLGTVIGMISAFSSIASASTVNAKVVAVGIQVALLTTAGGLVVAAPALAFFYFFSHVIQNRYAASEEIIGRLCEDLPRLSEKMENGAD